MDTLSLHLFNERVDRLDRCKLANRMDENPHYQLDYEKMIKGQWISADGINEDDIDAFVLNVRLLIQDNDGFSIRCLADNVYNQEDISDDLNEQFNEHRNRWREYIEHNSIFKHHQGDRNYSNEELFYILLYGGLAHTNRKKVRSFMFITKQGFFSSIVCGWFLSTLRIFIGVVRDIREVNKKLLEHYSANKPIEETG